MKKIKLLLASSLLASSLAQAADKITIMTTDFPPYVMDSGKKGITIDIVKEVFKRAGIQYTIKKSALKRALSIVEKKANHCVLPIERSQERETNFRWVSPILISQSAFFTKEDSNLKIGVLRDAEKIKTSVLLGSAIEEYLKGYAFSTEASRSEELSANKIKKGRSKLWAADSIAGPYYAKKAGVKLKQQMIFRSTLRALACNINLKSSQLEKLNKALAEVYKDKTVKKIFESYTAGLNIGDAGQFL